MSAFKVAISWFLFIFLMEAVRSDDFSLMSNMKSLKDRLFKDYDKLLRPINDTGNTTHVYFCMHPQHIVELDEDKSLLTLDGFFELQWVEPRLRWNMNVTGIEFMQFPITDIWRPDISLYNSHSAEVDPYEEVLAVINSWGTVHWVPPATTSTFCSVAPGQDRVTCEVIFGSWTHDGWEMNIQTWSKGKLHMEDFHNDHPRWEVDLETSSLIRKVHKFDCCEEPYLSIHIVLDMVRRPSPQVQAVRVPCSLVALLLLALLWVPPQECFTRVVMGTALFLVMLGLGMYVSTVAKSAQEAAGNAMSLVRAMTIVVTIVFLLQVITMRLSRCPGPARPSAALVRWLSGPLSVRACLWSKTSSGDRVQLKEEEDETEPVPVDEWGLIATAVDRIVFVACVPTLAILLLVD